MEPRHPRFSSLAQAVRAGIRLVADAAPRGKYFGVSPLTGRLGCDAIASAWIAERLEGKRPEAAEVGLRAFLARPLVDAYPALRSDAGPGCPIEAADCPTFQVGDTVEAKVLHLEDEHDFTREQVAQWLEGRDL
jgi:hypothetical protein